MGKSSIKVIRVITILLMAFIQGCNCPYTKRQEWLEPKYNMLDEAISFRKAGALLSQADLLETLGSPDYIVSPQEFKDRLNYDGESYSRIIERLVTSYIEAKKVKIDLLFRGYEFFKEYKFDFNCMLWLYDESIHFKKPAKAPIFSMCMNTGYCFCFYIEGDNVIGGTVFHSWKLLKNAEQQKK